MEIGSVPFKFMLEVKGIKPEAFNRELKGTPFTAEACPYDCSHSRDGGYATYQRISSKELTLDGGGLEQINDLIGRLRKAGATTGYTGALRFYLPTDRLDNQGSTNFVNMHLANEAILYRLASGGRTIGHKREYCTPISESCGDAKRIWKTPRSFGDYRYDLKSHGLGLNLNHGNWWELRYFDSTLDPKVMEGHVHLLLGMFKASAENRGQWTRVLPVQGNFDRPVSVTAWDRFTAAVTQNDEEKGRLTERFKAADGKFYTPISPGRWSAVAVGTALVVTGAALCIVVSPLIGGLVGASGVAAGLSGWFGIR